MEEIKLTANQEKFCQIYMQTGNQSEAYRQAYPKSLKWKPEAVNVQASTLMSNSKVSLRVKELQKEQQEKHNITKDRLLKELASIAFVKESEFYHDDGSVKRLSELTEEQKSALSQYSFKTVKVEDGVYEDVPVFKAQDKLKAIETISKMLGFNEPDKVEHSGEMTQNIKTLDDFYED